MLNIKDKQLLEKFVFKVSMEGFSYALANYPPPKTKTFLPLFTLPTLKAEEYLEKMMDENDLIYD